MVTSTTGLGSSLTFSQTNKKQVNRGRWIKEEDDKLKRLVETYGERDWHTIAGFFSDRSDVQCQQRWEKVVNPKLVKGPWTKEVCFYFYTLLYTFNILFIYFYTLFINFNINKSISVVSA